MLTAYAASALEEHLTDYNSIRISEEGIFTLIFIGIALVTLFIQLYVVKRKENQFLGLIFPILFFAFSIPAAVFMDSSPNWFVILLFLNIPTFLHMVIFVSAVLLHNRRRRKKAELDVTKIQDL